MFNCCWSVPFLWCVACACIELSFSLQYRRGLLLVLLSSLCSTSMIVRASFVPFSPASTCRSCLILPFVLSLLCRSCFLVPSMCHPHVVCAGLFFLFQHQFVVWASLFLVSQHPITFCAGLFLLLWHPISVCASFFLLCGVILLFLLLCSFCVAPLC